MTKGSREHESSPGWQNPQQEHLYCQNYLAIEKNDRWKHTAFPASRQWLCRNTNVTWDTNLRDMVTTSRHNSTPKAWPASHDLDILAVFANQSDRCSLGLSSGCRNDDTRYLHQLRDTVRLWSFQESQYVIADCQQDITTLHTKCFLPSLLQFVSN